MVLNLVILLGVLENSGEWPMQLRCDMVAALAKGDGTLGALGVGPLTIASAVYHLWAKIRVKAFRQWIDSWLPDSTLAKTGSSAEKGWWPLALDAECALATGHPLAGVLFDMSKACDRVLWSVFMELLLLFF